MPSTPCRGQGETHTAAEGPQAELPPLQRQREMWLARIHEDWREAERTPPNLLGDSSFVLPMVQRKGVTIQFVAEALRYNEASP